jgi:hypothetical protein
MPVDFRIGDVVQLRKPHPCGGMDWTVVRLGADIGLRCNTCGHRILLTRRETEHGMRRFVSRAETHDPFASEDAAASGTPPTTVGKGAEVTSKRAGPFSPDEGTHGD